MRTKKMVKLTSVLGLLATLSGNATAQNFFPETGSVTIGTRFPGGGYRGNLEIREHLSHSELFLMNSSPDPNDHLGGWLLIGKDGAVPASGQRLGAVGFEARTTDGMTHVATIHSNVVDGSTTRKDMTGDLRFATKGEGMLDPAIRMFIDKDGNVGIGTQTPHSKLAVDGTITTKELVVTVNGWADHVFYDDYRLMPLRDVEEYITAHKHLPGIPSEQEVTAHGISVGGMQARLLQKVEELTLHVINLQKETGALKEENALLKERLVLSAQ